MAPLNESHGLDVVESVFRSLGWEGIRSDQESLVEVAFTDPIVALASAFVFEDEHRFVFFLHLGTAAPSARFPEVLECVARANYGLVVGNWEMSMETGEVRFRVGVDYGGDGLSPELLMSAIQSALMASDVYSKALTDVIEGHDGAREAIEAAEPGKP